MARRARSRTPATSPRHPTCAAANTPSPDASATVAQSALSTAKQERCPLQTAASASGSLSSEPEGHGTQRLPTAGASTATTSQPCCWFRRLITRPRGTGAGAPARLPRALWSPAPRPVQSARTPPAPSLEGPPGPGRCTPSAGPFSARRRGRRTRRHPDRARPRPAWRRCPRAHAPHEPVPRRAPGYARRAEAHLSGVPPNARTRLLSP